MTDKATHSSAAKSPRLEDVPPGTGPLSAYERGIKAGIVRVDPEQMRAAARLDVLWRELAHYSPAEPARGFLGGLKARFAKPVFQRPRGLYLVGQVGRGKSMLMDLFFALAPVTKKRRVHFHAFMQETHARMHAMKRADPSLHDPIPPLARTIAQDAWLLCFDEFQVNDITDALILGRLFEHLFELGVVVVATSNTTPDALFQNRPGADVFKPFIAILLRELHTLVLDSPNDYRRGREQGLPSWIFPVNAASERALDKVFSHYTGGTVASEEVIEIMGRKLIVPHAAGQVARFDFDHLCGRPLGPGDYLALARKYKVLVVDGVPRLGPENFDVARRFITLVDALYEQRVKLFASAQDVPDRLYERGEGAVAFERTASRLEEMRGAAWGDETPPG